MKLKRTFVAVLIFALLMQTVCIGFGESLETHWAYKATVYLRGSGIISGDQNGNYNLENNITRAEFIKITNKSFGYTEKAETNFSDVKEGEWYYDELLAAKKAGYIKGDDNGNANPDSDITRNEASVILGRILGLEEITDASYFTDTDIPSWAIGYVNALKNKNILSGYEDGTFRGGSAIKRAEAFQLVYNIKSSSTNVDVSSGGIGSIPVTETSSGSGSSGGGGGGGAGGGGAGGGGGGYLPTSSKLNTPVVLRYDASTETITLDEAVNAVKFRIKISALGADTFVETSDAGAQSVNLSADIISATTSSPDANVPFTISVMAVAETGYTDSDYTASQSAVKSYASLTSPVLSIKTASSGGVKHSVISWPAVTDAAGYSVSAAYANGTAVTTGWTHNSTDLYVDITDLSAATEDVIFSVKAISSDPILKNSAEATLSYPKVMKETISDVEYYLVYNQADFEAAVAAGGNIRLMDNIVLGEWDDANGVVKTSWTPVDFGKELDGNGKTITVYINDTTTASNAAAQKAIFNTLSGVAHDFTIRGSIYTTGAGAASLAYTIGASANAYNITNYASVEATGSTTSGNLVGGIFSVGLASNAVVFENLKNYGTVTGTGNYVGGIMGLGRNSFKNCANFGTVTGAKWVGGIVGATRNVNTTIEGCYNAGNITAINDSSCSGGITGEMRDSYAYTVKSCYNTGSISNGNGGGIVGTYGSTGASTISNCYNTGAANASKQIAPANEKLTISNCYYSASADDGVAGTASFGSQTLTAMVDNLNLGLANDSYQVPDATKTSFTYPELINNPDLSYRANVTFTTAEFIEGTGAKFAWTYSNSTFIDSVQVTLNDDTTISDVASASLTTSGTPVNQCVYAQADAAHSYEIGIEITYKNGTTQTESYELVAGQSVSGGGEGGSSGGGEGGSSGGDEGGSSGGDEGGTTPTLTKITTPVLTMNTMAYAGEKNSTVTWPLETTATVSTYEVTAVDQSANPVTAGITTDAANRIIKIEEKNLPSAATEITISVVAKTGDSENYADSDAATVTYKKKAVDENGYTLVYNADEFKTAVTANENIKLMENITLGEWDYVNSTVKTSWTPLDFSKVLDGNGRTITVYVKTTEGTAGMFKNLTGTVYNLIIKGSVSSTGRYAGALAGKITGTIHDITNYASVTANDRAGGMTGNFASDVDVYNLVNYGDVLTTATSGTSNSGGIFGYVTGGTAKIEKCANFGNVTGRNYLGGIVGRRDGNITINNCYNQGTITSTNSAAGTGGIFGYGTNSSASADIIQTITNCYNAGEVSRGIAGDKGSAGSFELKLIINNCYNVGTSTGKPITGSGYISNCWYKAAEDTDGVDGTNAFETTLTADMLNTAAFTAPANTSFAYPEIIGNLNRSGYECTISDLASSYAAGEITFSWTITDTSYVEKVSVSVNDETAVKAAAAAQDLATAGTNSFSCAATAGNGYEIAITVTYKNGNTQTIYFEGKAE